MVQCQLKQTKDDLSKEKYKIVVDKKMFMAYLEIEYEKYNIYIIRTIKDIK